MKVLKRHLILLALSIVVLAGCASFKETGRGILGISTKEIEAKRQTAVKKVFTCDYKTAYDKTLVALANMGSYVYTKKDDLIAIYVSEENTTVVGIFFKAIDPLNTQIEVSSPSTYAKELVAKKLFGRIDLLLTLKDDLKKEDIDKLMIANDKTLNEPEKSFEVIDENINPVSQPVVKEEVKATQELKNETVAAAPEQPKTEESNMAEPIKQ